MLFNFRLLLFWPLLAFSTACLTRRSDYEASINIRSYFGDITLVPFHVMVVYSSFFCSGSLVASRVVVTAASCFVKHRNDSTVYIKYGSDSMTSGLYVTKAKEIKLHEFYQRLSRLDNDIAIVFMEDHVRFGENTMKVMLNEPDARIPVNTVVLISGWGHQTVPALVENRLIWSEMLVTSDCECASAYGGFKTPSNFCVKYAFERRLSDNGGPATLNNVLVGILSYGVTSSPQPYQVALVTNVSYFHMWIVKNVKFFLEKYCKKASYDQVTEVEIFGGYALMRSKNKLKEKKSHKNDDFT